MLNFNSKLPTDIKIGNKTVETVWMRNEVVWGRVQECFYIENTYNGSNRVDILVSLNNPSRSHITELQYSTDKSNWTTYQLSNGSTSITLSQGQRVYFRNDNGYCNSKANESDYWCMTFNPTQSYIIGGNINSLLDYTDMYNVTLPSQCFWKLFNGSSTLTSAADLTLVSNRATYGCYSEMFMNCTSLVTPPVIKATIIGDSYCYESMFRGCTSLTSTPSLPATTLSAGCYRSMFKGCTSLTSTPSLPATTLAASCYWSMFEGCTALTSAPSLPATTMETSCYRSMFSGCTSLTSAPALQATTLSSYCYSGMFSGCTSLTSAPALPAKEMKDYCYQNLFRGCTSLNNVIVCANDNSAENCTQYWLRNVAATGTFYNYGTATYTIDSDSGIPVGWTEVKLEFNCFYVKNESSSQSNVDIIVIGTPQSGKTATSVQYSYDKFIWNTINFSPNTVYNIPLNSSQKVYFRNGNGFWSAANVAFIKILSNKDYSVGGKLSTLIDCYNEGHLVYDYCFKTLFSLESTDSSIYGKEQNDTLVDASMLQLIDTNRLPIKTISGVQGRTIPEHLYLQMFDHCVNLLHSPEEVYGEYVDEQGCYKMFYWCQKLLDAPKLSPTYVDFQGYDSMFMGCQSLLTVPELLMTKVYNSACKEMFYRCKKMTGHPVLLPETIGNNTYESMFEQCTSLTEVTLYLRYYSGNNYDSHQGVYDFLKDANPNGGTIHNLGGFSSSYWRPSSWVISNS